MGVPYPKPEEKRYTFEEYLVMEEAAEYKSEYHDGKIIAMSGGTSRHSGIGINVGTSISVALKQKRKPCKVFNGDLKIRIETKNRGVYPDVSVVCEELTYYKNRQDIYTNPLLIVEVLSKSTRSFDRGDKFALYRTLPSFREYVLIHQKTPKVEFWYKVEENVWRITNLTGLDKKLPLFSLDCEILMEDIYYLYEDFSEFE